MRISGIISFSQFCTIGGILRNVVDDDLVDGVHVSELPPPKGLLFIPQVIYDNREQCWNDICRGKLPIRLSEFSGNPTSSHQVAKLDEGNY
jgi:hypothetical protein